MNSKKTIITILLIIACLGFIQYTKAEETCPSQQEINVLVRNDFSDYMKNVQEKLSTTWQPPDFMEEGHVRVYFKLNRQGRVMNATIIESSGNDIYDESALEAIKDCAPFGDFPEDSLKEFISIKYSFDTILIEEERMNGYYELAKTYTKNNPQKALEYLNLALARVGGEEASCFLYKRRAELNERLGYYEDAQKDYETYDLYTNRANIKRVHLLKHMVETKPSAYLYHYLAYAYEQINDYDNALIAIDKAINLTDENANMKHYRDALLKK